MLNFNTDRYLSIQRGALRAGRELATLAERLHDDGLSTVFFLGAGGAGILMDPAAQLLAARSRLRTFHPIGAELVAAGSPWLDATAVVVVPSLSGTTPDAIEQVEFCRKAGARVVCLLGDGDTPLAELADHVVVNPAADDTSCESFYLQSHMFAMALLGCRGEADGVADHFDALASVPQALVAAKHRIEPYAARIAEQLDGSDFHLITGAGPTWPQAYYYAMCILEEMQWIRTRPVQASDFFHGSLELVEPGISALLFKGEGPAREQVQRVQDFLARHTDNVTVLDSEDHPTPGIAAQYRPWLSPIILAAITERISAHLEVRRDHPLTTRRYYRKVAY